MPDAIVTYKTINGFNLNLHICFPRDHRRSEKRAAIVFFFGGGWNGGTPEQCYPQCAYLAARGMVAMAAEYRVNSVHGTTASRPLSVILMARRRLHCPAVEAMHI